MLKNKKAVIFDVDGSLVDSMWVWKSIDIEYLNRFKIKLPSDLQQKIEGMSFTETAEYFKERFQLTDSIEEIKNDWNQMAWEKYSTEVFLKPGAMELLNYAKENDIYLAIATSNSRELVDHLMKQLHIFDFFSCIMTACDAKKGKPAPDIYLKVADELGVKPERCLVFEDLVAGIMAGKSAGMQVCAVADDYSAYQWDEKKELADYYIHDYTEIDEIKRLLA